MNEVKKYPGQLVFGLDIGTRSVVGTVGYKDGSDFIVVAQQVREHDTRAMMDGQIHDIGRVGETIKSVKNELEVKLSRKLKDVCIAAAGRVLQTRNVTVSRVYEEETKVSKEDIYSLHSSGVEQAFIDFQETNNSDMRFFCVGYSVVKYYLNGYPMGNLENHKAKEISADMIVTFLPDDVVDGLYKAVELAGLSVVNLTLEPIAAIQVAIPEMYRMLNIALVDVGAGTSDISITKDGSIVAYGMIPSAGDKLTEVIARHCLVDFHTAEEIKRTACESDTITYKDIMGLEQTITTQELKEVLEPLLTEMTTQVGEKMIELNGGKPVSAVFVVGGGGKIPGYTEMLSEKLGIQAERVALRGEEVMGNIHFLEDVKKDSLLVTPIGICLNFYEQSNNFIFVTLNGERIKLYDNDKLTIVDAAMQANYPNAGLFPKRGKELYFTINGRSRIIRGQVGEPAVITLNGENVSLHTSIHANDIIEIKESTAGAKAQMEIGQLPEYKANIHIHVNEKRVTLPKFASVNGSLQSAYYEIKEDDDIEMLEYYTVGQIVEFMDVILEPNMHIYVNNKIADRETKVFENFNVIWSMKALQLSDVEKSEEELLQEAEAQSCKNEESCNGNDQDEKNSSDYDQGSEVESNDSGSTVNVNNETRNNQNEGGSKAIEDEEAFAKEAYDSIHEGRKAMEAVESGAAGILKKITVIVNKKALVLEGKRKYVFVDIFDYIDFDRSKPQGRHLVTNVNGRPAEFLQSLQNGDNIEIYWNS